VLINQLRDQHPGSIRQTFPDAGRPPGIMLVRISHRQQQLEFERQVHELIYRVEESYWQLYSAYWDLYSSENGLKQAHAAWQVAKARFDAGGLGIEDLAMIEEQYHFFRNQRVQALGRGQPGRPGVLEAERRLRYVVGLPPEDGTRLTPLDAPEFLAYDPDLNLAVADAETFRPELKQVDEEIRAAELNLIRAKDRLKPDLRFVSRYGLNGLGQNLDESIEDQVQNPHHEWELGLRLQVPIGYRAGHADTARAHLQLTQRMAFLQDQREKLVFSIQRSYQELVQYREQYKIRIRQREAAALQLKARSEKFKAGGDPKQPGSFIDLLLRAQRNWADALREEYIALCNYRIAVTDFERQKGTILRYANIAIADGPAHDGMLPEASGHLRRWRNNRPCPAPIVVAAAHPTVPVVVADSFPVPDTSHARDTIGLVPPEPLPAPRQAQPENARPDGKEAMGGVNSAPVPESRPVVASSSAAAPANVADTPPRPSLGLPSTNGPNED
jgi:outer membrane protein TolC